MEAVIQEVQAVQTDIQKMGNRLSSLIIRTDIKQPEKKARFQLMSVLKGDLEDEPSIEME